MLRRNQLRMFFTQLPPCQVGMEACAGSHYWGRELKALGHEVKLIPAQHVKPYLLGKGISILRKSIHGLLEDAENGLSPIFRNLLARRYEQLVELDGHIDFFTHELEIQSRQDDACQRLQEIPGYGPIIASAFYSAVGNGKGYSRGRDVAASLGLVPGQHSTGGKNVLLGISKRGDGYLRGLLIHGARAVVIHACKKMDKMSQWINRIVAERGKNKAAVAVANKMARIGWAVLRNNSHYQAALTVSSL